MKILGRIFFMVAELIGMASIAVYFFTNKELSAIYLMCLSIGMMVASNRWITDSK